MLDSSSKRVLLRLRDHLDAARREVEQLVEPVARERRALGRRLHLDHAPVAVMTTFMSTSAVESSVYSRSSSASPSTMPTETAATETVSALPRPNRSSARRAAT